MAIIKCKMCGGDLILEEGSNVAECEYCGTRQTVPTADNEKKMSLFARANRLRANNEFDKAAGVYESIVADFPEEAEAYWGLILCKYGIEYVDDPGTGKKIPTCHRSSFDSLMDDQNFELVMEYADPIARRVYREEAKQIEELRKGIIEVSSHEEPYDIFICYKETAEDGQRTLDSVLAQDVYDMLTENGYRVFFSRVSLEDKLGVEYEPYIFAALNSAKIMLAFGTDYDYYNAVWVKNEWSRFLQLIAKGEKKVLIPCFKNLDAYDMPKEFAKLQAQDLGKVGANQDLLRGIKKILPKEQSKADTTQFYTQQATAVSVTPMLRRASLFLEDGEWQSAEEYYEKALDQDPENAQAYFGKVLVKLQIRNPDSLSKIPLDLESVREFQRAEQFADPALLVKLNDIKTSCQKQLQVFRLKSVLQKQVNRIERIEKKYISFVDLMNTASTEETCITAAKSFQSISGFRDADDLAKQCIEKAEECRKIEEENCRIEEENRRIAGEKEKRRIAAIAAVMKAGCDAKKEPPLEEKYAKAKERVAQLTALHDGFDALLAQAAQLKQEQATLKAQEASLTAQREKLGIFAGKEKKRIDETLSELSNKKRELAKRISQNAEQCCGYESKEAIDREIMSETAAASEFEAQIENNRIYGELTYSYSEAVKIYLREPEVTLAVNAELYPNASQDSVMFGRYYQKKNGALEPIEWQVLERDADRMLVISKHALDCKPFDEKATSGISIVFWKTCSLNKWLNGTFLNVAFSKDEMTMISNVIDSKPGKIVIYHSDFYKTDKAFLLGEGEMERAFPNKEARICEPTDYAIAQSFDHWGKYNPARTEDGRATCSWWLRESSGSDGRAKRVSVWGNVDSRGVAVGNSSGAVRPALWINLGS